MYSGIRRERIHHQSYRALISSFDKDADLDEETTDLLDEFDEYWTPFIHEVKARAPQAMLLFIWGNHERRIVKWLNKNAPKFRQRILRDFIDIIRCGSAVQYLGYVDKVRMGPLVVAHGTRVGENSARNHLKDYGYQVSGMSGHVHYPSESEKRGEDFRAKWVVSGCLCDYPHYGLGETMTQKWALGTAIAYADLRSRDVDFDNRIYQSDHQTLWVNHRGNTFQTEIPRPTDLVTFREYLARKIS